MDKVLQLLDKVKSAGDVAVSADPVHAGLPWAGIRIILEVALAESHQRAALITGLESVLYISNRLKIYQDVYSCSTPSLAASNLRVALTGLYVEILTFLAQAIRIHQRNSIQRFARALWDSKALGAFEQESDKLCIRAAEDARLCGSGSNLEIRLRSLDKIHSVHESVQQIREKIDLGKLKTAEDAMYNSMAEGESPVCLPDTRVDLLEQINSWATDDASKRIFWLCGNAGTGKSTISRTVAQKFDDDGILGATSLDQDSLLCQRYLSTQFDRLLLQPFRDIDQGSLKYTDVVLVIDALDECDSSESIKKILLLLSSVGRITSLRLRIFVTSRPELPVELGFLNMSGDLHDDVRLEEAQARSIAHDIRVFYEHQFACIRTESLLYSDGLPVDWPGEDVINILVNRALPLFIFAFTVSRYISVNPRRNLATMLQQSRSPSFNGIKDTYLPILRQVVASEGEGSQAGRISDFKSIVGSIILLFNPLPTFALARLLDVGIEDVDHVLRPLHSVLNIPRAPNKKPDRTLPITLFHLSFRDFLIDPEIKLENPFWINATKGHHLIGMRCISLLRAGGLRENICGVKFPGTKRSEVAQSTVHASLAEPVVYACRYWAQHLVQSDGRCEDDGAVHRFLKSHLLHWMEALSWLGEASNIVQILGDLQHVADVTRGKELLSLLRDANRFALRNRFIIDQAPLQIYVSSLLFAPTNSDTRQTFGNSLRKYFDLMPRVPDRWGAERQKLEGHISGVQAVAFSPDGTVLMTAAHGGQCLIRLWDASTGEERQRFDNVWSLTAIAISPDWTTAASGSSDMTVSLWDLATGEQKQKLKRQSDNINALTFSSDGKVLVSGSQDKTVWVWDLKKGENFAKLEHDDLFEDQALSPGGTLLLSWSNSTATLWNIVTGEKKLKLKHQNAIETAVFSPDSMAIAFGFVDHVIIIWDIKTRKEVQRLEGHTRKINVLAFSPDGSTLASGSSHGMVRVWDIASGQQQQTITGHGEDVDTLAFSPDCRVIASGSRDTTARLWDLVRDEDRQKLDRLTGSVCAIALSPNRTMVALGFADTSVRLWDVETGAEKQRFKGELELAAERFEIFTRWQDSHSIRFWDTATGHEKHKLRLEELSGATCAIGLSPDGKKVVTGSDDKTVRAWDAETGENTWVHRTSVAVRRLTFPDDVDHLETDIGQLDLTTGSAILPVLSTSVQPTLTMDTAESSWIKYRGADFLWLPHEYRGVCDISGKLIVIGHTLGTVSAIEFK